MDLKNLMATWKEYQKWLKDQGINSSNIQEKLPEFVENLKQDPEKLQQLKGILNDKSLLPYAKQLNISETDINKMKGMLGDSPDATSYPNAPQRTGNLTPQQLEMLRKFKRKGHVFKFLNKKTSKEVNIYG